MKDHPDAAKTTPIVNCPTCRKALPWDNDHPERPFCSPRCRDNDFVDWAHENHRIAGEPDYSDNFSDGDLY